MSDSRLLRKYRSEQCLNCKQPLDVSDKYCPNCSQLNTKKKLSLSDAFNEFFSSIISYDSRLRKTLVTLLFRPGKISRDYIEGKRQRYANPFRFYFMVSIVFFIVYGFTINLDDLDGAINDSPSPSGLDFNLTNNPENLNKIPLKDIDSILQAERAKDTITYKDLYLSEKQLDTTTFLNAFDARTDIYEKFYDETKIINATIALDSLDHKLNWYNTYLYNKSVQMHDITKNLSSLFNYFISKLPFIIFFYLPVFGLFIWLIYIRHNFTYMEHLVFIFHVQSMFFVLFTLALGLNLLGVGDIVLSLTILVFLFYLYKALRKFYQQGRFKTIIKFTILNVVFLALASIGAILAFLVSFATY